MTTARRLPLALFALVLSLGGVLVATAPAAVAADPPDPAKVVTTVTFSGTYSDTAGTKGSQHFCGQTYDYTYTWSETATTTDANMDNQVAVHWHYTSLTGTSALKPDDSPACSANPNALPPPCSAPISERPGWEESNSGTAGIYKIGDTYNTYAYPPYFNLTTQSTCGGSPPGPYSNPNGADGGPYQVRIDYAPAGQTISAHGPADIDTETAGSDGTTFRHRHSSVTLTMQPGIVGGIVPPPTTPAGKAKAARQEAKDAAKADLKPAFENAKGPCLQYAMGLGLFGAGTLLLGAPSIGPTLTVAGALTALAMEPFCVATITRIANDYKVVKDPPDVHFLEVVHVAKAAGVRFPACTQKNAKAKAFCKAFVPAAKKWVTAEQDLAATTTALSTTMNRLTGAIDSKSEAGETTQAAEAKTLIARLATQKKALKSDGAALARVYRSAGIRMPVSSKRAGQAVQFILGRLKKKQVTAAELTAVSPSLLSAAAFDALAKLAAG